MKTRTKWARRGLWLAGFGCLWLNVVDDPPLYTEPYVQNVTTDAATIAQIRSAAGPQVFTVFAEGSDQVVGRRESPSQRRHAVRFEGLAAGQRYRYEVEADGEVARGSFRTAPVDDAATVRFAFCGDSGDQPWWVWLQRTPLLHLPARWRWFPTKDAVTRVGAAMAAYEPDFALHLGDVVYPKGLHAHYSSGFFRPFAALLRDAPVFAVLGNHDVMNAAGVQILANFDLPTNALTGDERNYSFAWGPVRVIALDCNTFFTDDHFTPGHPTHSFLLQELERVTEPWVVVASHFPMRSASRQGDNPELLVNLLPALEEWQVTLYLSGHDHCYQRFGPSEKLPVPLVVSGGGGKRLYDITDNPRARREAQVLEKAHHWCGVEVEGDTLRWTATSIDGEVLDDVTMRLPEGGELARLRARSPQRAARIEALQKGR